MERKEEKSPLSETVALTWAGCHWGLWSRSYNRGKVEIRRNKQIKIMFKHSKILQQGEGGNEKKKVRGVFNRDMGMRRNKQV